MEKEQFSQQQQLSDKSLSPSVPAISGSCSVNGITSHINY